MRAHRRKRALESQIKAILFLSAFFLGLGAAHASTNTPSLAQDQCRTSPRVDAQHACACDNIKQVSFVDPAPFTLERSDLKNAYQNLAQGTANPAEAVEQLKQSYEHERNKLFCHNETVAEVASLAISEAYCFMNPTSPTQSKCNSSSVSQDQAAYNNGHASTELLAAEARMNETITKYFSAIDSLTVCEDQVNIRSLEKLRTIQPYCKIDLEAKFPDNTYELTAKLRADIVGTIKNDPCFKRNEAIAKVEIISSSSLFANTGKAANLTFEDLSKLRADTTAEIMKNDFSVPEEAILKDYQGKNKGKAYLGTSGPCPYQYDALKDLWETKPEYRIGQKNLNEFKKVTLNIYFNEVQTGAANPEAHRAVFKKCKQVRFKCAQ